MRTNLSVQSIAGALAVLATGVAIAACGDKPAASPVDGKEVSPAGVKGAGEKHCGADKPHAGETKCGAAAGGDGGTK